MGWPVCNTTLEDEKIDEVEVFHGFTFHQLGLLLSIATAGIALLVSFYLIMMHATHYLRPWEQRHIIRILFMVPVYAAVSFLSYLYYQHSIYFETARDCYEAFAIASFFALLCHYVAEDLHQQKNYFRSIKPRRWVWPLPWLQKCCGGEHGIWRTPRSGLTWFNIIWVGVFQYCFIRVFFTVVAVITQAFDLYCENSLNPAFAHIWVMGFEAVAVTIAMYCIIQFYLQLKNDIASHKPLLKVAAIKLVIFLSFWQSIAISFFTSTGLIKAGPRFGNPDIKIGIPAMLLCMEMAIFAIFHLWAFSWLPYRLNSKENLAESVPGYSVSATDYQGGFLGVKALADAFNPWDLFKAVGRSARWLFVGRKRRMLDPSYNRQSLRPEASIGLAANPAGGQENSAYKTYGKSSTFAGDEGEELLTHAQSNPASGPPPAYSHDARYDQYPEPAEIGVARSTYGDDESIDDRSQSRSPIPYPQPSLPTGRVDMPSSQDFQRYGRPGDRYPPGQTDAPYSNREPRPPMDGNPRYPGGSPSRPGRQNPNPSAPYPERGREEQRHNRVSMPPMPPSGRPGRDNGGMF